MINGITFTLLVMADTTALWLATNINAWWWIAVVLLAMPTYKAAQPLIVEETEECM